MSTGKLRISDRELLSIEMYLRGGKRQGNPGKTLVKGAFLWESLQRRQAHIDERCIYRKGGSTA